jgi:hypothetical protein
MPFRPAWILALLVVLPALPAVANPPAAPAPQKVRLRWKVPQGTPLGYELTTEQGAPGKGALRLDLDELRKSGLTPKQRQKLFEIHTPSKAAMAAVLSARPSGELSAKVVVTQVEVPRKKRPSKQDREMAQAMKQMEGTVRLRGSMTDRGFVTSDLKREQRNLLALLFELPSQPVAVGDTWTHSADLVNMGNGFEGESESLNQVHLVSLEKEAEGRTVARIDFTLAERQDGTFSDRRLRMKKALPAMMEMFFVGQGEFLVEQGRWRQLAGRLTTRATGVIKTDSEQQLTLTPLDPIPAQVLAAE